MNNTIYYDINLDDDERRRRLFEGQIFVYSPKASTRELCALAQSMAEEAFPGLDPREAQHHMSTEKFAEILGKLKPAFIHHPEAKRLIQRALRDVGADLETTYFDVPRMRTSTSDGYLTTGIAYAWHPHRDTWYSAPSCQVNWWMPVYDLESSNAMAFHPRYWNQPVKNSSRDYNYYVWNKEHRGTKVLNYLKEDPRPLPRATEPVELDPQIRIICPVGGFILFSGAQLHSSVPNTSGKTRFSIDFRTLDRDDAFHGRGAPNIDSECGGTSIRDFLRGADFARLPEEIAALYDDGTGKMGELIYQQSEGGA